MTIQLCGAAKRLRNDFLNEMIRTVGKIEIWDKEKTEDFLDSLTRWFWEILCSFTTETHLLAILGWGGEWMQGRLIFQQFMLLSHPILACVCVCVCLHVHICACMCACVFCSSSSYKTLMLAAQLAGAPLLCD